jgi:hypothetical protein
MEITLIDALQNLRQLGYVEDFNLQPQHLSCRDGQYEITHEEFHVDHVFRFEGDSNPSDETVLYAISSEKYQLKGVLVNAYGIYSEPLANEMIAKLR